MAGQITLAQDAAHRSMGTEERVLKVFRESLSLTGAQARVLYWIVQGKRNREIAELLKIHSRTVEKHIEHIFDKLGVETRTAAATHALECLGKKE